MDNKTLNTSAAIVAYLRSFTDIPYAAEMAAAAELGDELLGGPATKAALIKAAPRFEARFNSITKLVLSCGTNQILEMAAGLSTRGMVVAEHPQVAYVETDASEMIQTKEQLVERVLQKEGEKRPTLRFAAADALDSKQMTDAVIGLNGALTIVTEGLLAYFREDQLKAIARNIHHLLSITGGIWITPDFITRADRERSYGTDALTAFSQIAGGESIRENSFDSDAQIEAFIAEVEFTIEVFSQLDLAGELTCVEKLGLDGSDVRARLVDTKVYCLRPRK